MRARFAFIETDRLVAPLVRTEVRAFNDFLLDGNPPEMNATMITMVLTVFLAGCAVGGPTLGLLTYGACQTACNAAAVTCYAASGVVFGMVTATSAATGPVGWWAWLTGAPASGLASAAHCSAAQGACMAACAAAAAVSAVAPTA